MPPRKALPGKDSGITRPMDRALDTLTDPEGISGVRGTRGVKGTLGASGVRESEENAGSSDVSATVVTRGTSIRPKAIPREHVKLRRDLADEMRDAVWFLSEHGRPRVQLGELLDEAIDAWLIVAKEQYNDGHPFPHRGRLR